MPNDPEERDLSADDQTNEIDDSWKWEWHGKQVIIPNESEDRSSAAEETVPLRPPAQTTHDDALDAMKTVHAFDRTRKRCGVCNDCCSRQPIWCESWGAPFEIALTPPAEGENGFGVDQETGERFTLLPARDPIIPTMQGTSVPPTRIFKAHELTFDGIAYDPGLASSRWIAPNREWRAEMKGRLDAADLAPLLQEWPVVLHKGVVIANNAPSQGSRVTFNYTYAPQPLTIWKRLLNRCSYLFGRLRYRVLHWS